MLKITTQGSFYERGKQQGKLAKDAALKWMLPKINHLNQSRKDEEVKRQVIDLKNTLNMTYPEGYEECCGIASGLGIPEDEYFKAVFAWRLLSAFENCTTISFIMDDNKPVIGKTDDIFEVELGANILEFTYPGKGYRHAHFHFAGTIWSTAGMNECGLCMGMTGIPGVEKSEDGFMALDALHTILPSCKTVNEAIAHLEKINLIYYGFSLMLGDTNGDIALVEKTGNGMSIINPSDDGFLIHTNHILDSNLAERNPKQNELILINGINRYNNAKALTNTIPKTKAGMEEFLNNRNSNGAIRQQGEDGLFTDYGVLFLPAEKKFSYYSGYPNYNTEEIVLSRIFN